MARQWLVLLRALPSFLKYAILGISVPIVIYLSSDRASSQTSTNAQAQALTQAGHVQLERGEAAAALQSWQAARKLYLQSKNEEGAIGSSINQSLALQSLGLYPRACNTLAEALELELWLCQSNTSLRQQKERPIQIGQRQPSSLLNVIGLRSMGNVLRNIDKLRESEIVLRQAYKNSVTHQTEKYDVLLSLANTERALYVQALNRYQLVEEPVAQGVALQTVDLKLRQALTNYQKIVSESDAANLVLQAKLNYLSLVLDLNRYFVLYGADLAASSLQKIQQETKPALLPSIKQLLATQFDSLPDIDSIYARLNFANSMIEAYQITDLNEALLKEKIDMRLQVNNIAKNALKVAENINNIRAKSYALKALSQVAKILDNPEQSRTYLVAALRSTQSVQAWDIAYQIQQQLGMFYNRAGDLPKAIKYYKAAIASLDRLRSSSPLNSLDSQFLFRKEIEPIYKTYIKLLLSSPSPDFQEIVQVNSKKQTVEIENFLQCAKIERGSVDENSTRSSTAYIYIIDLDERVEAIVNTPERTFHAHTIDSKSVKANVDNLMLNLQQNKIPYTKPYRNEKSVALYSQELYQLLISPIEKHLSQAKTLVFALDSSFQNVPMALLYDGKKYLIEKYSISNTLGLQLQKPQMIATNNLRAVVAGVSEKSPSYRELDTVENVSSLPEVISEINKIKASVQVVELLNQQFTTERLQQKVSTSNFPIVHLTTHGQFSSDPDRTLILAWDRAIDLQEVSKIVQSRLQNQSNALELLVLSACQTAKGDRRSVLGLAGVSVQSGARSTLATLWFVDAKSTAQLMGEFYRNLKLGKPKAEALQQAQLSLIKDPNYRHPFYWSGFLLLGSWL
ncbi:CHAT domain-containing protein [Cyanosarcina cf. burmensis CCALA 770]|jgi:CHAT domain-containing protein|nr:CHAT domain-containing protein [Cyanosarcina cf. burmensis CCALA 770]